MTPSIWTPGMPWGAAGWEGPASGAAVHTTRRGWRLSTERCHRPTSLNPFSWKEKKGRKSINSG